MPIQKINDIDIYYEQHGQGPDLVLIGGLTSDHQVWRSALRVLSEHFRVLIFDNRGAGRSGSPNYPYSIEMMAHDTLSLMTALSIEKAHVVGHSMGGGIAMQMALSAPERVEKLVIVCAKAKISAISSMVFSMREKLQDRGISSDILAEYVMPFLFAESFLRNTININGFSLWTQRNPFPQTPEGYKNQLAAAKSRDVTDELHVITAPALVIAGAEDMIATAKETHLLAASIKNCDYIAIDDCGHMPHVEKPQEFSALVLAFLLK